MLQRLPRVSGYKLGRCVFRELCSALAREDISNSRAAVFTGLAVVAPANFGTLNTHHVQANAAGHTRMHILLGRQ